MPFGKYKTIYFPEKELLDFSQKSINFNISNTSFENIFLNASNKDVVYADPPYAPLTKTSKFNSYSMGGGPYYLLWYYFFLLL